MTTVTFRTDPQVDAALRALVTPDTDRSSVIREAILAAWRRERATKLRAEAGALAADVDDVAEMRTVQADLESLRAW